MAQRREILPFNGLRALAAWWVVFYHFDSVVPVPGPVRPLIHDGALAVDLFFVLSGFVIGMSYTAAFATGVRPRAYAWFIGIRLARIYPLHVAMLGLYALIPLSMVATGRAVTDLFPPAYLLQSVLLIQNWGVSDRFFWNLPAWSISTELLFYLAFPFLAAVMARLAASRTGMLLAGAAIALSIVGVGLWLGSLRSDVPRFGALRCLAECALGFWVFLASRGAPLPRSGGTAMLLASLGLAAAYAAGWAPDYAVLPFAFACLLWGVLDPAHPVSRALSHPVLLGLGLVSFSTYMVHFFVRDWIKLLVVGWWPPLAVFAAYVAAVAAASVVMYRWVEVPGRRIGRRLADRWAGPGQNGRRPLPAPLRPTGHTPEHQP